jgi:multidrug resistance efflux pump
MKKIVSLFKNKKFLKIFGLVLLVVLLAVGYIVYQLLNGRVFIDDSLIQAPIITISPSESGKVQEMDVNEGQYVQKGDQLAIVGSETLRADTDGLIVSAPDETGSSVDSQTALIQMIRTVDLRVAGTIDENKGLNEIKVGQIVSFTVDAYPGQTFWGYVDEVSPTAKATQISFSISNQRPTQQFVVYAKYDAAKYPQLKNGMSAKMTVYTKTY